jgi:hypothetical protein
MNASDPNFFILLLLGGAVLYGLMPTYGAMMLALAALWVLGKAPLLFFVLAGAWLFPWRWFLAFVVAGFGLGEGLKLAGFGWRRTRYRYPRRRAWDARSLAAHDEEFRRGRRPADYAPFDDPIDIGK